MNTPQYNRNGIRIDTDRPEHFKRSNNKNRKPSFATRINNKIVEREKIENMIDPRFCKSRKKSTH